jgi:hypothetical protein
MGPHALQIAMKIIPGVGIAGIGGYGRRHLDELLCVSGCVPGVTGAASPGGTGVPPFFRQM